MKVFSRIACFITGFPYQKIADSDFRSRQKVSTFAIGLILVVMMNMLSAYVFANEIFGNGVAYIVVPFVGIASYLLDRLIIGSHKNVGSFVFRIVISLLMAQVFSIGSDVSIFASDIELQVQESRSVNAAQKIGLQISSKWGPQLKTAHNQDSASHRAYVSHDSIARAELLHRDRPGWGPRYKALKIIADSSHADWKRKEHLLRTVQDSMSVDQERLREKYLTVKAGPLEKLRGLHEVIKKDELSMMAFWCLFALFCAIDMSLLCLKMFSRPSSYEIEQLEIEKLKNNESKKQSA